MVQVQNGTDPLLRRPISLCGAGKGTIELLFQVKGRGTRIMSGWEPGRTVDLLGPLGNGFSIPENMKTAVLVAGGIGAAPLLYLAHELAGTKGLQRKFFFGAKTGAEGVLVDKILTSQDFESRLAAEDGTAAFNGFVTDMLEDELKSMKICLESTCVFSCGPEPMLKKVAEIAQAQGIPCRVSLEARMACGVGACLGCAVATTSGYSRVCADGPVFDSRDIVFEP
jgi:dihydroorotate dehydrogenase electron transfer subunit